jgi:hypothetical protein
MSHSTERGIREDGVRDQKRISRIGAEGAFEIGRRLPVVAVAHGEARRQVGPGKPGAVLRGADGGADHAAGQGREHGKRSEQSNDGHSGLQPG